MAISFEEARPNLGLRACGAHLLDLLADRRAADGVPESQRPVTTWSTEEARVQVVLHQDRDWVPVSGRMYASWGRSWDDVFDPALLNCHNRGQAANTPATSLNEHTVRYDNADLLAVCTIAPRRTSKVTNIPGSLIFLPVTDRTFFVGRSDDLAGLEAIAAAAEQVLLGEPDLPVIAHPLVLVDDKWEPFPWPTRAARRRWGRRAEGAGESIGARVERAYAARCDEVCAAVPPPWWRDLARVVLTPEAQRLLRPLIREADELGEEQFEERHPDLRDVLGAGTGPETALLAALGQDPYPLTVPACDWSGEDDTAQIRTGLDTACRNLGLTPPVFDEDTEERVIQAIGGEEAQRGDYVPALLRDLDAQLRAVDLRVLLIDVDSDTYEFAPVSASDFARLDGTVTEQYRLHGVDEL